MNSVPFSDNLVINIIINSNVNKAHGHDDIFIRMIKMSDKSLVRPVSGHFPHGQLPPGQLPPMKFLPGQLPPDFPPNNYPD